MYVAKRTFTVLAFLVLLLIGAVVFFLFRSSYFANLTSPDQQNEPLSHFIQVLPSTSPQGKIASAGVSSAPTQGKKLTIIFFYDGYETRQDALLDVEVMKQSLDSVEPFMSMKDTLDFKVFTTDDKKCRVENSSLVCDPKLIDSFRKLGTDHFKVVLMSPENFKSNGGFASGKNSWITISTNAGSLSQQDEKRWLGILFTHFLGKSLGLFNEYEEASFGLIPSISEGDIIQKGIITSGQPNCAPDLQTAQKWWGGYKDVFPDVGFYQGCGGDKDFYYPEKNTLMSSDPQKESFGAVSTDYLRGVLSCFYGEGSDITFPAGETSTQSAQLSSCSEFKKAYPDFWSK